MAASSEQWSTNKEDYELQDVIGTGGTACVQVFKHLSIIKIKNVRQIVQI